MSTENTTHIVTVDEWGEEDACSFCGEPAEPTDEVLDAWQIETTDYDYSTEDMETIWVLKEPPRVKLRVMVCGCVRVE